MLNTEFECTHNDNVFVFRPLGRTVTYNGVWSQEFEAHRCTSECSYGQGTFFAPARATRAEVIDKFFGDRNTNH